MIRRIKGLKLTNSTRLSIIVFKSFIRSLIDYSFIPLSCSTQRIISDLQVTQNNILRHINFFSLKTRISEIQSRYIEYPTPLLI
ncbi:hypothetical protein BpHYR1_022350 [Brachionus plicatilis]|uniref:RNA-directed DNA polymerase from mobile element jockey-like n=1 Tax=Brachionus plicatilis TaxID=10195 RepID=A0A3M7T3A0_BRAPC|nr:hypothetical protein BpHYR1_022350 [Brachionus plicatilis]